MKYKCAYIGGTFDLFHAGHVNFLRRCKDIADYVVISLNTDKFCAEYKRVPIYTYAQRRELLKACRYVDSVVENTGGKDSGIAILSVMPDVIIHGDDWTGDAYLKQLNISEKFLKAIKCELKYIPYTKGISSSKIIKLCRKSA